MFSALFPITRCSSYIVATEPVQPEIELLFDIDIIALLMQPEIALRFLLAAVTYRSH